MERNDRPKRPRRHRTGTKAVVAFEAALEAHDLFFSQGGDREDFGVDLEIEALDGEEPTNFRVQMQVKGTESAMNADNSVSVSVKRSTLNYLEAQPHACLVCYHIPTQRLLVCTVADAQREVAADIPPEQKTVTVRFRDAFDEAFQRWLHGLVLAEGRANKGRRDEWNVQPPEQLPPDVKRTGAPVHVPLDAARAHAILETLYKKGDDTAISAAFDQFEAVLDPSPGAMDLAYMAKVNLAINGRGIDEPRVRRAIARFDEATARGGTHPGSLLYCQGNAWMALGEYEKAREVFERALDNLREPAASGAAAMCWKNLGTTLDKLGDPHGARASYERALALNPNLGEAHFALAMWHRNDGTDLRLALDHLDQVRRGPGSALRMVAVQAWRIELLFRTGDVEGAFREINRFIAEGDRVPWALNWSARLVARFGRISVDAARRAVVFWEDYLREQPGFVAAERQRLFSVYRLHKGGVPPIDWRSFRDAAERVDQRDAESALLWDLVGHWAQDDKQWADAAEAFRQASDVDPDRYGYCLGTALNFLGKYGDALPLLLPQAAKHQPDALSWLQVAIAREGVGDTSGCIAAYARALELDPGYALAWFNLGGIYFNAGDIPAARATWTEALKRFPEHLRAAEAREILSRLQDPDASDG